MNHTSAYILRGETNMFYITGDTHGSFYRIEKFCRLMGTTKNDTIIILGDVGLNYYLNQKDAESKEKVESLPINFFCIHGNHEERPQNVPGYKEVDYLGGKAFVQEEYPSIAFAKDGEVYNIDGNSVLVLGGAYSVDKNYRLSMGYSWFSSEQIPDNEKIEIEKKIENIGWKIDYVLSHTCPYNTRPVHMFLSCIDQRSVDSSMEIWLQKISEKIIFKKWYFGHYHGDWNNGKYIMLFNGIVPFPNSTGNLASANETTFNE